MNTENFNKPLADHYNNLHEQRKSKRKKVAIIVTAAILAFVLFICALVFGIMAILRNHPAYHMATSYIKSHPEIIEAIGEVEGFGFFPTGSVSTVAGGRGDAEFTIRVDGSEGTVRVHIQLVREPLGEWEVVRFRYRQ